MNLAQLKNLSISDKISIVKELQKDIERDGEEKEKPKITYDLKLILDEFEYIFNNIERIRKPSIGVSSVERPNYIDRLYGKLVKAKALVDKNYGKSLLKKNE